MGWQLISLSLLAYIFSRLISNTVDIPVRKITNMTWYNHSNLVEPMPVQLSKQSKLSFLNHVLYQKSFLVKDSIHFIQNKR